MEQGKHPCVECISYPICNSRLRKSISKSITTTPIMNNDVTHEVLRIVFVNEIVLRIVFVNEIVLKCKILSDYIDRQFLVGRLNERLLEIICEVYNLDGVIKI